MRLCANTEGFVVGDWHACRGRVARESRRKATAAAKFALNIHNGLMLLRNPARERQTQACPSMFAILRTAGAITSGSGCSFETFNAALEKAIDPAFVENLPASNARWWN